jgi:hypothetical protein
LPKPGANSKRGRDRRSNARRRWAAAVVRKATPKIVESLLEAAASLGERRQASQDQPPSHGSEEGEDESLAALLLRLLRTPDTGENGDAGASAMTSAGEHPLVG